jgi:plasmid stability protein
MGDGELVAASGVEGNRGLPWPRGPVAFLLQKCSVTAPFWSSIVDLSIKSVPEDQVRRLRERAKANHRSLQGELRALIDEATGTPHRLGIDEIVARVRGLNLTRRDEAVRLIREDRDR